MSTTTQTEYGFSFKTDASSFSSAVSTTAGQEVHGYARTGSQLSEATRQELPAARGPRQTRVRITPEARYALAEHQTQSLKCAKDMEVAASAGDSEALAIAGIDLRG